MRIIVVPIRVPYLLMTDAEVARDFPPKDTRASRAVLKGWKYRGDIERRIKLGHVTDIFNASWHFVDFLAAQFIGYVLLPGSRELPFADFLAVNHLRVYEEVAR